MLVLVFMVFASLFVAMMVDGHSRADRVSRGEAISEGLGLSTLLVFGTFAVTIGVYLAFRFLV